MCDKKEWDDRLKKAMTHARWKAQVLKGQGYEKPWGIAILDAARAFCKEGMDLYEFQRALGRAFRENYFKVIERNKKKAAQEA